MSGTTPALLAAAAGVGFGHAVLPDHWVPLAVLGRSRGYPLRRVARLSGMAGVAHVLVSLVLGAIIIAVGLQFRSMIESAQSVIIGALLIATGVGFMLLEVSGRGHIHDHDHDHAPEPVPTGRRAEPMAPGDPSAGGHDQRRGEAEPDRRLRGLAAVMVPFGAAASPDLTILPVFLAATAAGLVTALGTVVIFTAVTIGTITGLTLLACFGGYQLHGELLDRWGNVFTALVLIAIGALVLTRII